MYLLPCGAQSPGSVAAIKLPLLVQHLLDLGEVRVITTSAACHFIDEAQVDERAKPFFGVSRVTNVWPVPVQWTCH